MKNNLSQLFQGNDVEVPTGLSERVFAHIDLMSRNANRASLRFSIGLFVASLGAFIASGIYAVHQFAASNFGSYFSLIFSDSGAVVKLWRELGLSLIESLPIFGVVIFLASISFLLWSIRKLSKRTRHFITHPSAQLA